MNSDLVFHAITIDRATTLRAHRYAKARGRVLERDHFALLTWGEARRIGFPGGLTDPEAARVCVDLLSAIEALDVTSATRLDALPVAIGAFSFDPTVPGELIVPLHTVIDRGDDDALLLSVGPRTSIHDFQTAAIRALVDDIAPEDEPPDSFTLHSSRTHEDFRARVAHALEAIATGELEKVVLAREVIVEANRAFSQRTLLERLRVLYPSCASFAIDGFLGASPELLCRRSGSTFLSRPLAGTVARSGDPADDARLADELLHSAKERAEHAFVIDAIVEAIERFSPERLDVEGPHLLELRNVTHLETSVHAEFTQAAPNALEFVSALHPTPAVGGTPRDVALSYIAKHEGIDRDRYAGPVGYINAEGDGEWWLGLRSATVSGNTARLISGVGIVASSDPQAELIETQLKLQALLAAAVRP